MRIALVVLFLASIGMVSLAVISAQDAPKLADAAKRVELEAAFFADAPPLKAESGEAWNMPGVSVEAKDGRQKGAAVRLKARYDSTNIYLLAQWADASKSDVKAAWEFKDGKWIRQKGDEDRLALAFNVNSPSFKEKGCAGICHGSSEKKMHCLNEGEQVDLWHWKAARGGQNGWADDQVINATKRGDDKGKSAYKKNENGKDASLPGWVWAEQADRTTGFEESAIVAIGPEFRPADGEKLPSNVMRKPEGSRADVQAFAAYADGKWTVLFVRKLDTGNADDAKFAAGEDILFSLAVMDDCGTTDGDEHAVSELCVLRLKK